MTQLVEDKVKQLLPTLGGLYHRLILLVGEVGSGKTTVLHNVAVDLGVRVVNVNLDLSKELLPLTTKQRALRLPDLFAQIADTQDSVVILDNLEIIFHEDLKQNPLRLLQSVSRNRVVLAAWGGRLEGGKLIYAEMGHPEFRTYDSKDTVVVTTNK